jgi:hypothetical protein
LISLGEDQNDASPYPVEGEGAIEVYAPVLLDHWGKQLLCFRPFRHEIRQCLGFDCRLGKIRYVKPHELESPLGNPSRGEVVPDNFPEPM